ncbi:hypothetical protein [Kitasatospora sp. NPDC094011]|uniref:hypothetical protein n=1 Tax=Kitasatospora sp. NPDC094011 TaxID=3364090 RepID=UPI00380DBADD
MLIKGHDDGPLVERAGFWSHHPLAMCRFAPDDARPVPEWFGDDGADTDALSEVLLDDRAWPVFRIPFHGGHSVVLVHRNLIGDYGTDYLLTHGDWPRAEQLAGSDGDCWYGPGLSWHDLVHIAGTPDPTAPGVHDTPARLLLLLPLLTEDVLPPEAPAVVSAALTANGAPGDSARDTADHLLRNRRPAAGHPGGTDSPLSGGSHRQAEPDAGEPDAEESAVLWALDLTRPRSDALADALGRRRLPASSS